MNTYEHIRALSLCRSHNIQDIAHCLESSGGGFRKGKVGRVQGSGFRVQGLGVRV